MLSPWLRQHYQRFGYTPRILAGVRDLYGPDKESLARHWGVEQIVIPQTGLCAPARTAYEKQDGFKKGLYFRNDIEGRSSVVKRSVQLRSCPAHGSKGLERWVGMSILVANMVIIARALHRRRHRKRRNVTVPM